VEVSPARSAEAFFRDLLLKFLKRHPIDVAPHTEVYIVGLLNGYSQTRLPDEALCILLLSQTGNRTMHLKEVGDTALFVTGFYPDSFDSPDYYMTLGASAYSELSNRFARSVLCEIYGELAEQFPQFVDLLQDMRQDLTITS
jgi:hypothetical protein